MVAWWNDTWLNVCTPFIWHIFTVFSVAHWAFIYTLNSKFNLILLKCFWSFVLHTVQICGSIVTGRSEAVRMIMQTILTIFISNFCTRKLCRPMITAAVCCNSHVQEDMISSNGFTSIQGKTISWLSEFRVSLQKFGVSFRHPKTA